MDFGKKSDAKKAMKLMWKEGITLKQAWKCVKSGKKYKYCKKSAKKSAKMSPKKKRAVANAKKAMKLKWRDGITLKQAWAKVNRFGDTVCPPGKVPNVRWNAGKGQRECIDECKFYQVRNPLTNRCRNVVIPSLPAPPSAWMTGGPQMPPMPLIPSMSLGYEINPDTGRRRRTCVPPEVRNLRGRCVVPRQPILLKPGYEINQATGRQRKICELGSYRDPVSQRCRRLPRSGIPPGGAQLFRNDPRFSMAVSSLPPPPPEAIFSTLPTFSTEFLMPPTNVFGKRTKFGKRNTFGRKCGFGSCKSCNLIV